MEVQLNLEKVLELTRIKLHEANDENLMLHCIVEQQYEEIANLKGALDLATGKMEDQEDRGIDA